MSDSFEARLLRLLNGQVHQLLKMQAAHEQFGKPLHMLSAQESSRLGETLWSQSIMTAYEITSTNTLTDIPTGMPPSGKAH